MTTDNFIEYPQNAYSQNVLLGDYRGFRIYINVTRGDDGDMMSVNASNYKGIAFCRSYGKMVLWGGNVPQPSDLETKKEVDGLKISVDNYVDYGKW